MFQPFKSYMGYIAKDHTRGRACHVFNCFNDAAEVVDTIAEAFSIKYRDVLDRHSQNRTPFEFITLEEGFCKSIFDDSKNTPFGQVQNNFSVLGSYPSIHFDLDSLFLERGVSLRESDDTDTPGLAQDITHAPESVQQHLLPAHTSLASLPLRQAEGQCVPLLREYWSLIG